ncbi:MAG: ABC transporter substrate-binding protein [Fimbriimonadaceae bacterium]
MPRHWLAAASLVLLFAIVGCGKGNFSSKTSAGMERIFRYSLVTNPTHVDPALVEDGDTIDLTQQIFEGLVMWNEKNEVVGNLAKSWDISKDGKTYTFKLQKGVTFSNGEPLTAADFKWSIERACNPLLKSETAEEYMSDIVGVSDCVHGRAKGVAGITAVDDLTLKIEISKPVPYFLDKLTYPCAFVVCEDAAPPITATTGEMLTTNEMIGTGPFIATRYVEDQVFDFAANKNYHGGAPLIDGIERPILKDAASRLNKFKAGEVDLVQLERQDILAMKQDPKYSAQLHFYPRPATYYLAFNTKVYPPFAKRDVRRAFAMAINTQEICTKTLDGLNPVANGILPPGVLGHRDNAKTLPFDPVQAKRLLAQAGYPDPSKMPPLDLYFRAEREDVLIVAEAIQSYLQNNLGVTVTLKPLEWLTYLDKNNQHALPMYHMRWSADYLDPQDFLSLLLTTTGNENKQNYSNPEVDALCARADVMPEKSPERLALYAKAEDIALQDAAWLPIYFESDAELISPRVHGLRESLFGHLPHTTVSLHN